MSATQLFPPLDSATEAALRASIERFGVLVPVVVDQHGELLDGHHRSRIAGELGAEYPTIVREVADEDEAREIARTLNEDRRMLTREERLPVVRALREDGHSQTAIANALGVSQKTVWNDLNRPEVTTSRNLPAQTTGLDGKTYPATKPLSVRQQQNLDAAVRRVNEALGSVEGTCKGLFSGFNLQRAIAGATPDQIAFWTKAASQSISALSELKRHLREAGQEVAA